MEVERLAIPDVLLLRPRVFVDERGRFFESWSRERYREAGIFEDFVQDNTSVSKKGVLRGLHAQQPPHAQGKLVSVLQGAIFDVMVDVRRGSRFFGAWLGLELRASDGAQVWIPPGFLHGFQCLEQSSVVHYKCTAAYQPAAEFSVRWNDHEIGIRWPLGNPVLSIKDADAPRLSEVDPTWLALNETHEKE
jgi:dTDP-4-dehydrorhamnose 3,5-epimerase